jgi:hypothetical protein
LKTGEVLATPDQTGYFQKHTQGRSASPINGVFYDTGEAYYKTGAKQIAHSGFAEVEVGGGVNAYLNFSTPIGDMQYYGTTSGNSSLGKAVLVNNPSYCHWYPGAGYGEGSGVCAGCKTRLF